MKVQNVSVAELRDFDEYDVLEMFRELGSMEKKHFTKMFLQDYCNNPKEPIKLILEPLDSDSSSSLLDELRQEFLSFAEYRERAKFLSLNKVNKEVKEGK